MVVSNIAELEMLSCIRSVDAMAMRIPSSAGLCVFSRGLGHKDMRLLSSVGLCVFSRGLGHRKIKNMGLKSLS